MISIKILFIFVIFVILSRYMLVHPFGPEYLFNRVQNGRGGRCPLGVAEGLQHLIDSWMMSFNPDIYLPHRGDYDNIDERITAALIDASKPLSVSQLRPPCRVRKATLCERLTAMTAAGNLHRDAEGYRIAIKP